MAEEVKDTPKPKAPAAPATIEVGDEVLLQAVGGYLVNMTNPEVTFDTDRITKCVVDNWTKLQLDAKKLELVK